MRIRGRIHLLCRIAFHDYRSGCGCNLTLQQRPHAIHQRSTGQRIARIQEVENLPPGQANTLVHGIINTGIRLGNEVLNLPGSLQLSQPFRGAVRRGAIDNQMLNAQYFPGFLFYYRLQRSKKQRACIAAHGDNRQVYLMHRCHVSN